MNNMDCFMLGALFTLGTSFSKDFPFMQVFSFISLFYYTYSKLDRNKRTGYLKNIIDLHGAGVCSFLLFLENRLISYVLPNFKSNIQMRLGAIIIIVGYGLSLTALLYLQMSRSTFITNGPYKVMRMPYYSGIIIFIVGSAIYMRTFCTLGYLYTIYKNELKIIIDREEVALCKEDENYRKYMNSVKLFGIK